MTNKTERTVSRATVARRINEYGEWVVRAYDQHGKRYQEADYFTNDRADAVAISNAMVASVGIEDLTLDNLKAKWSTERL